MLPIKRIQLKLKYISANFIINISIIFYNHVSSQLFDLCIYFQNKLLKTYYNNSYILILFIYLLITRYYARTVIILIIQVNIWNILGCWEFEIQVFLRIKHKLSYLFYRTNKFFICSNNPIIIIIFNYENKRKIIR